MCLSVEKRAAMSSFYAFCRVVDDVVDSMESSEESKRSQIAHWREEIKACYLGSPTTQLGRELAQVVQTYLIPPELLFDILDGVEMDITPRRFATFEELSLYCYRVASAVGLVSINIFEYRNPQTREFAHALGMAFQLTNILRDVFHDLEEYGRVYLPQDELRAYGITEDDLKRGEMTPALDALFRLQAHRAEHYFAKAARLIPPEDRANLQAALIMTEVYHDLLRKLQKCGFSRPGRPVKLGKVKKMLAVMRAQRRRRKAPPRLLKPQHIVVAGAGFAGVAAALTLSRQGHRVELLEAKAYSGGRAHSFTEAKTGLVLDNGQHIFMGCYHACLDLMDQLGVRHKLDCQEGMEVPYRSARNGATRLKVGRLPAPLHLLQALLGFKEIGWKDRWAIIGMGVVLRIAPPPSKAATVETWLHASRQTNGAIRALWEPLCLAALNEPISSASARLFHEVLRRSLFGPADGSAVYTSRVGLSQLFMPEAAHFLTATGGSVHIGEGLRSVEFQNDRVARVITSTGREISPDHLISAVPPAALASLLPESSPLRQKVAQLPVAPILGVHLFTDRPLVQEPFVGILDSPLHWIFQRPLPEGTFSEPTWHSACVSSAAYAWEKLPAKDLIDSLRHEIEKALPETRGFVIRHHVIYKSRDATLAARPQIQPLRPGSATPWKNLWLVGDWIDTQLPSTLEGAVWSGQQVGGIMDSKVDL
jgi:squalene synthase HpnD